MICETCGKRIADGAHQALTEQQLLARGAEALEESFRYLDFPGTRMPGTESVDCEHAARIVLEAVARALSEESG